MAKRGSKDNPSSYNCAAKALPDEPAFTLLARDPYAPACVRNWASWAMMNGKDPDQVREAFKIADDMQTWRENTDPDKWRNPARQSRFKRLEQGAK